MIKRFEFSPFHRQTLINPLKLKKILSLGHGAVIHEVSCGVVVMNSFLLRQLWAVIESIQAGVLLRLSDTELVRQLMSQLSLQCVFSPEEADLLSKYIRTRASLIRDVACSRQIS
jgi:hypothetical protein